jgi:pyrimidine-specific ribonucleoside hydrolase
MKIFLTIFLSVLLSFSLSGHPWKPSHYVIIDTDGGVDDMKAIIMLLASPDVRVLGITVSPGILETSISYIKVRSLLNSLYHEGLPVAINRASSFHSKNASLPLSYGWGDEKGINPGEAPDHYALLNDLLSAEKTKVTFLCLGGLSTAYTSIREIPLLRQQVREIIWSADGIDDKNGFNYSIDKQAASVVMKGTLPLKIIKSLIGEDFYNDELIRNIKEINNPYAATISSFMSAEVTGTHKYSFRGTDEMIPLYLHYPQYFVTRATGKLSEADPSENDLLRASAIKIIKGETVVRNQVIRNIPADPSFYFEDIGPFAEEIISKYGEDEWVSGVFANELHRHLGVFAIIGVKMGIRAREYFNTGVDEFRVTTFAGSEPPLSCMNDGIQVSTGATPGHGLLTVSSDSRKSPSAEFSYLNRKIRLTLKPEIASKISSELKEINFIYGLDSNIYWELVRKNSIKYWHSLDRHNIFIIENVN